MRKTYLLFGIALVAGTIYLVSRRGQAAYLASPASVPLQSGQTNRIVSLCKHPVPIIILGLDASDRRLAGLNPGAKIGMQANVLSRYFPGLLLASDKVCTAGFSPNMEEIVQLKPDLVLTWNRFPESIAQMQGFGLHAVGIPYDGSDQNDRAMVNTVAAAIGREAMADSIMKIRDSIHQEIKTISDQIPFAQKPKTIFFYNYETLRVGGEHCYEHYCITLAGGRNMGDGLGVDRSVDLEQILEWDPDVILLGGWLKQTEPADIYQNPMLADVSAVRHRRVFKTPIWASNESYLIWQWMAQILQPGYFQGDLRETIRASYLWQYKIKLTESDIDQVLFYSDNAGADPYQRFRSK